MELAKHRTSFALDNKTAERLKRLARHWNVSQAEVVRRAVKLADEKVAKEDGLVRERLLMYRKSKQITEAAADQFLSQIAKDRADWGRDR
jgi:Arc/MetJ-type ribon-helix-helix transcriptional regulator